MGQKRTLPNTPGIQEKRRIALKSYRKIAARKYATVIESMLSDTFSIIGENPNITKEELASALALKGWRCRQIDMMGLKKL